MNRFRTDSIAFIGRTMEEYSLMFGLDLPAMKGLKVLDCPGGACSFTAESRVLGIDSVAADALYGTSAEELRRISEEEIEKVLDALIPVKDRYRWDFYGDVEGLKERRVRAYNLFIKDYEAGVEEGRYLKARLPELPFPDGEFDIVLSAHLLFLYGDRLDYDFHLSSARELVRVSSKEVRIFPLLGLDTRTYPRLDDLIRDLEGDGLKCDVTKVPFEFQDGGDHMLRIFRQ